MKKSTERVTPLFTDRSHTIKMSINVRYIVVLGAFFVCGRCCCWIFFRVCVRSLALKELTFTWRPMVVHRIL